jgi:hypothetical protein
MRVCQLAMLFRSEQRTQVWSERIANRQSEQGGSKHECDAHHVPEPPLRNEGVVAVLNAPTIIHVFVPPESLAATPKV